MLLNDGNDIHFTASSGNTSSIDFILSSSSTGSYTEWKVRVLPAINNINYWPIIINIIYRNYSEYYKLPSKWMPKNPKWELYTLLLVYVILKLHISENENVELTIKTLEDIIMTIATQTISITQYVGKKHRFLGRTNPAKLQSETKKKKPPTNTKKNQIYSRSNRV